MYRSRKLIKGYELPSFLPQRDGSDSELHGMRGDGGEMRDRLDYRVIKTVKMRIAFALPLGLVGAFLCGGWLPLIEPNARRWSYILVLVLYWLSVAGMIFIITWFIDRGARS